LFFGVSEKDGRRGRPYLIPDQLVPIMIVFVAFVFAFVVLVAVMFIFIAIAIMRIMAIPICLMSISIPIAGTRVSPATVVCGTIVPGNTLVVPIDVLFMEPWIIAEARFVLASPVPIFALALAV
jgi:hypothetical protein